MKFTNLKIATRLMIGFGGLLILLTLCAGIAILQLSELNGSIQTLTNDRIPKMNTANAWIYQLMETARHTRNMLILSDPEKIKAEIDATMENKKLRKEYLEELQQSITLPDGKKMLQAVIDARAEYTPFEDQYLKLVHDGDMVAAKEVLLTKARPTQLAYISELRKLVEFETGGATQDGVAALEQYKSSRNTLAVSGKPTASYF